MQHNNTPNANHFKLGVAANNKCLYTEAVIHFEAALKLDPENSEAYRERGFSYYRQGKYALALKDLNAALSLNPEDAIACKRIGSIYLKQKRFSLALRYFNHALNLNPNDCSAFNMRGNLYFQTEQNEKAANDLTNALRLKPSAIIYTNLAIVQNLRHYHSLAIANCKAALKLDPTLETAYEQMEIAYIARASFNKSKGLVGKAIHDYVKAIKLNPNEFNTSQQLADILNHKSKEDIFALIKQLPRKEAVTLLKNVLEKDTLLGKKFRETKSVCFQWSVKPNIMDQVRKHLTSITAEQTQIKTAARLIAQGQRDPHSAFFILPQEVGLQIAAAVNDTLYPEKVKKLVENNYGIPRVTQRR